MYVSLYIYIYADIYTYFYPATTDVLFFGSRTKMECVIVVSWSCWARNILGSVLEAESWESSRFSASLIQVQET